LISKSISTALDENDDFNCLTSDETCCVMNEETNLIEATDELSGHECAINYPA
jgi:hypothetical protein